MSAALAGVAAALHAEGGLAAQAVGHPEPGTVTHHGDLAASGPRARSAPAAYAEIVEAVREGHLTHRADGPARIVTTADPDLALLVGDRLYALGLSRLAQLGDLDAVAELADVIVLGAQAYAVQDDELAEAAWEAGAVAVGFGTSAALAQAKSGARAGDPAAALALRAAARQLTGGGANGPGSRIP